MRRGSGEYPCSEVSCWNPMVFKFCKLVSYLQRICTTLIFKITLLILDHHYPTAMVFENDLFINTLTHTLTHTHTHKQHTRTHTRTHAHTHTGWGELESGSSSVSHKQPMRPLWQEGWQATSITCAVPPLYQPPLSTKEPTARFVEL